MSQRISINKDISPYYGTFSGGDMVAYALFPDSQPIVLGELTTVTYSIHRDKTPVRPLGRISPKGYANGTRTIAGTLIFTVLTKHVINKLKDAWQVKGLLGNINRFKTDELPPFDIIISFGNEYGASAKMAIYGVTIVDEGKVMSIEDMYTENTMSYMAHDIDLMDDVSDLISSSRSRAQLSALTHVNAKFSIDSNSRLNSITEMIPTVGNPRPDRTPYYYTADSITGIKAVNLELHVLDTVTRGPIQGATITIASPGQPTRYGVTDQYGSLKMVASINDEEIVSISATKSSWGYTTSTVNNIKLTPGDIVRQILYIQKVSAIEELDKVIITQNSNSWPTSIPQQLPDLTISCYDKYDGVISGARVAISYQIEPDWSDILSQGLIGPNINADARAALLSAMEAAGYRRLNATVSTQVTDPTANTTGTNFITISGVTPKTMPRTFKFSSTGLAQNDVHITITIVAIATKETSGVSVTKTARWSKSTKVLR